MTLASQPFDIIIAGGGLSGALSAIALSRIEKANGQLLSIAIIEPSALDKTPEKSFDDRVLALSHATVSYLTELDVWPLLAEHAQAIENIHISDRGHYGKARLYAHSHGVKALGYVLEMSLIGQALLARLRQQTNVHWFCPDAINSIEWQAKQVAIQLSSGQQLNGQLLLGCDGAQSQCRAAANIQVSEKAYGQWALITNVVMAKPHRNIAYERFTEFGPIAMLPLTDGSAQSQRCSLVWTLTPAQAQDMQSLDVEQFKQALEQAFGSWLGAIAQVGKRFVYPLNLLQANEQVFHRLALIGNASHTIHPIAGQGFNLGVRDVQQLATDMALACQAGDDIGNFALLSQYANKRQADHQQVITLTDSLVTLFSNQHLPLVVGRNIGLKVLNYLKPLKNMLVNKTMGY